MKNNKLHSTSAHVEEENRQGCFDVGPARPRPPSRRAGVIDRVAARASCWSGAMSLGEGVTLPGLRRKDCRLHSISGVRLESVSRARAERPRRFSAQPSGIFETNPEMIWIIATNKPVFQLTGSKISFLFIQHVLFFFFFSQIAYQRNDSYWNEILLNVNMNCTGVWGESSFLLEWEKGFFFFSNVNKTNNTPLWRLH